VEGSSLNKAGVIMASVGSLEAKTHLPELLERVAQGEEFTITEGGKPVARLIPATKTKPELNVLAAVEAIKQFRNGRTLGGLSAREMIEDGRRF
jgi:prevent-host-death family protein